MYWSLFPAVLHFPPFPLFHSFFYSSLPPSIPSSSPLPLNHKTRTLITDESTCGTIQNIQREWSKIVIMSCSIFSQQFGILFEWHQTHQPAWTTSGHAWKVKMSCPNGNLINTMIEQFSKNLLSAWFDFLTMVLGCKQVVLLSSDLSS